MAHWSEDATKSADAMSDRAPDSAVQNCPLRSWEPMAELPELPAWTPKAVVPDTPPGTHWIRIELIDEQRKPVPGEEYRIVLTDGREETGQLDDSGAALVEGIPPGLCSVFWPTMDKRDLEEQERPSAWDLSHWIVIELKDQDGKPIPDAVFDITLQDNSTRRASTNSEGKAVLSEMLKGLCTIVWVDGDARDFAIQPEEFEGDGTVLPGPTIVVRDDEATLGENVPSGSVALSARALDPMDQVLGEPA
ncbi:MAG: hypothetical protein SFZ23_13335 [Planctomycetota bacterium]|nr:hypothetical protein [Planctomycetota bacterium]